MLNVHEAVLVEEIVKIFSELSPKVFVDMTVGAGGHARAIAENCLLENGTYVGFDRDSEILKFAQEKLKGLPQKVFLINESYDEMEKELKNLNIKKADAFLIDLGVSSLQLDSEKRGFSFRFDSPLDMRMDYRNELTAYEVVNNYKKEQLGEVFKKYSDFKKPFLVADKIIKRREISPIKTTKELAEIFAGFRSGSRRKKIHPATTVFQAIRIEVNDELEKLKKGLKVAFSFLNSNGVLAVISFHSLEDRIVKNFFKDEAAGCVCSKKFPTCICKKEKRAKIITRKPVTPSLTEIKNNKRSRSAKLRVLCKL